MTIGKKRGEIESRALSRVRSGLLGDSHTDSDIADDEGNSGRADEINLDGLFGFTSEEADGLCTLLRDIRANQNENDFPDFICTQGFIEHFQVSGTGNAKKAADYHYSHGNFFGRVSKAFGSQGEGLSEGGDAATFKMGTLCNCLPVGMHEGIWESFQRSWQKHETSRTRWIPRDYEGKQIFLVELVQPGIEMYERIEISGLDGRRFGDLYRPQHLNCYRLSRDKVLLDWIYHNSNGIDYVLYLGPDNRAEAINVGRIPTMLKLMPWDYCIQGGPAVEIVHACVQA